MFWGTGYITTSLKHYFLLGYQAKTMLAELLCCIQTNIQDYIERLSWFCLDTIFYSKSLNCVIYKHVIYIMKPVIKRFPCILIHCMKIIPECQSILKWWLEFISHHPSMHTWRLYNISLMSMQHHDVTSTLMWCINVMCPLAFGDNWRWAREVIHYYYLNNLDFTTCQSVVYLTC